MLLDLVDTVFLTPLTSGAGDKLNLKWTKEVREVIVTGGVDSIATLGSRQGRYLPA